MKKTLIVLFLAIAACADENNINSQQLAASEPLDLQKLDSYLIFGHFFGECGGEACVENFIITNSLLREDSKDHYGSKREFEFNIDLTEQLQQVKDLSNSIPEALLDYGPVIGCPDCTDGGGIYIEIKTDGVTKHWSIDKQRTPGDLIEFVAQVEAKIDMLQ
jgi:hypothetical protein